MTWAEAALLGLAQGLAEWLPVSSEGIVAAVHSLAFDADLKAAVSFSLWLHLGTALAAVAALRRDIGNLLRDAAAPPRRPTPMLVFLVVATAASAPPGLALLLGLPEFSQRMGAAAMAVVGGLMLITGLVLLRRRAGGRRIRETANGWDGILTGLAQGLAVLPGLSRSGLTASVLLWRGFDRREALTLSFLLSVPASLAAGLYAAGQGGFYAAPPALAALVIAAVTGFITVKVLLKLAERVNFGWFVIIVGLSIMAGGLGQVLT